MEFPKEEAKQFFIEFYGGYHHFPSELRPAGEGWMIIQQAGLSTFDFANLTRLVVLAHDKCIHAEIAPFGMNRLKIMIHKRSGREGKIYERHPDLEENVKMIREFKRG
jgi:hypothetical protein